MSLNKMLYCVLQASYSAQVGDGVISQELEGGAPRFRRVLRGTHHTANVGWKVRPDGYQYLMAFYRVWARNPSKPFLIKLCIDNATVEEYQAYFNGSPTLDSKQAFIYSVSASLWVKPLATDDNTDDLIVAAANDGSSLSELLNPLEELVNEDFPNALRIP